MRHYDADTMARLVSEFRKSVTRLKKLSHLKREDFLSDPDKIGSTKYHFIVAIESSIDMCNHLISRNGFRVPEDYADTFRVLTEEGAFGKEFSNELVKMAKFRNRLVHLYWEVSDQQLWDILSSRLSDFKRLLESLSVFIDIDLIKP
jgi:uncharacterized protein YutE (UPF0331/DUF86 family)